MNTEIDKTSSGHDGHPDENQLLLALERELSPAEVLQVEQHLGNCWSCRARSSEIQRGILAFVEYREKRYLPSLPTPPHDFREFSGRLRSIGEESKSIGLPVRIWRRVSSLRILPNQVKWVTVTAVMMVLVIFWTRVVSPPAVSASELLTRAAAAQNPNTWGEKSGRPRTARQRVRITSGQQSVVRDFEWTVGSPIAQARWAAQTDPLKWNAPLTAEGFAQWRDSVSTRKDRVKRTGDRLTLETMADDLIKGAWIVVRAQDFHPVEQHIRFWDDRQLHFEELDFEINTLQSSKSPAPNSSLPPKLEHWQIDFALHREFRLPETLNLLPDAKPGTHLLP